MTEQALLEPTLSPEAAPTIPGAEVAVIEPIDAAVVELLVEEVSIDGMCGVY